MENHTRIRQFVLRDPDTFASEKRPTVSLVILVRPGDTQVSHLIDEVVPHVDEVVLVTVDVPSEQTESMLGRLATTGKLIYHVAVTEESHPELYFRDDPGSYAEGSPLGTEVFGGPFTGKNLIADWSKVRNLGWKRCSQEWRVMLDGNEAMVNPAYIRSVCEAMDQCGRDLGYSSHVKPSRQWMGETMTSAWMTRIARNGSHVHWVGEAQEILEGGYRPAIIEGSMIVVREATGSGEAFDLEQFKTLYAHARRTNWDIAPCNLLYMARLANLAGVPDLAEPAISAYLETSLYTEERAWACALRGEMFEAAGQYDEASHWYGRSMNEHPGYKSAYRLCRSSFKDQKWQACLDAFQAAVEGDEFIHMVDDGNEDRSRSLILVAAALAQLGRMDEAKSCGETLRQLFPESHTVQRMCEIFG